MENLQITLDEWMAMKDRLKAELMGVKRSFVRIGFALRKIEENRYYEQDGYKSVAEFAKNEYGLEPTTTSRFMAINRAYSIDGYSEHLRPEYAELGRSQLEEMLTLPDLDRQMIRPETARADIRGLKQFNKAEPETGVADEWSQLVYTFFEENAEILNDVFAEYEMAGYSMDINRFSEIVNPSGNRSYRKGMYFVLMYEEKISVKKFGVSPMEVRWEELWGTTLMLFGRANAGGKTWEYYFAEDKNESGNVSAEDTGRSSQEAEPKPEREETDAEIPTAGETEELGQEKTEEKPGEPAAEIPAAGETEELGQKEPEEEPEEEDLSDSEIGEAGIVEISEIAPAQKPANTDKQRAEGQSKPEVIKGEIVTKKQETVRLIDANKLIEAIKINLKDMPQAEIMIQIIEVQKTLEIPTICPNCGMGLKGAVKNAN